MNGIEKIIARIEEDAAATEAAIRAEHEEKLNALREKTDARIRDIRAEAEKKAAAERSEIEARAAQSGVTAARDRLLGAKRELIDEAFARAIASFADMDADTYRTIMGGYLAELVAEKEFAGASCTLVVPEKAPCTADDLIAFAGAKAKKAVAHVETSAKIPAGFLLKTGEIESPCTPDKLIGSRKEELTAAVASVLFGA